MAHSGIQSAKQLKQAGFNLIELLVVISIIALITSSALLVLSSSRQKSRNAKRVSDVRQIISALDLYYLRCNSYPNPSSSTVLDSSMALYSGTGGAAGPCGTNGGTSTINGGIGPLANVAGTTFVGKFIAAPNPPDGACSAAENSYTYTATGVSGVTAAGYTLSFCLGATTGGYSVGVNTIVR